MMPSLEKSNAGQQRSENMLERMIKQQLAVQKTLLQRYAGLNRYILPTVQHKLLKRRAITSSSSSVRPKLHTVESNIFPAANAVHHQTVTNNYPILSSAISKSSSGPRYDFRRLVYDQKMNMPSAFPLISTIMEVPPLELPKLRGNVEVRRKPSDIDWQSTQIKWWMKQRATKQMRHMFYVAWFFGFLKTALSRSRGVEYPIDNLGDEAFLFEIQIKEIIAAIHRIYLDKNSEIFKLIQTIMRTRDLLVTVGFEPKNRYEGEPDAAVKERMAIAYPLAMQEVVFLIENIIYQLTFIQPRNGILGAHKKSALFALIQNGQLFPLNELWDIEKAHIKFDFTGRTTKIDDKEAGMLLTMAFLARGLVWTLLLHPLEYGVVERKEELTEIGKGNLQLMATIFIFIYRRVTVPREVKVIPPMPKEIQRFLFPDDIAIPLYEDIENSLFYCDGLLREWASTFVRRLRQAVPAAKVPYYS